MRTEQDRNALVEANLEFARQLSLRLVRRLPPSFNKDDLFQQACLGLLDAASRWEPQLGVAFTVYARRRVMGSMLDSIRRRHWRAANAVPLDEAADVPAPDTVELQIERTQRARRARQAVLNLPDRELRIVKRFYFQDATHIEIAPSLGVGANRVGQLHRQALRLLRPALGGLQKAA